MKLSSKEIEKVLLSQTVESRIKVLNTPLGIIPVLVWSVSLYFHRLYSSENSEKKKKPTDVAQNT